MNYGSAVIVDPTVEAVGSDPLVGRRIGDKYLIEARLGSGGMGAVYRAHHFGLKQPVAIKICHLDASAHPAAVQRFLREAEVCASLSHPNSVRVHDRGQLPDGRLFIVMELLRGQPLDALIASEAPLPPARAAHIGRQIAKSLAEAHAHGIVHRDLKPANVFICDIHGEADFVKVVDFGIAKSLEETGLDLTQSGVFVGTPGYASPEQLMGHGTDARSDLYALGLILYEMATGERPYAGARTFEDLALRRQAGSPSVAGLSKSGAQGTHLGSLIARLLDPTPGERYQRAEELVEALGGGSTIDAAAAGATTTGRRRWVVGSGLLMGAAAVVVAAWAMSRPAADTASPGTSAAPPRGGVLRLTVPEQAGPLDLYTPVGSSSQTALHQVVEPLIRTSPHGDTIPMVARAVRRADDDRTLWLDVRSDAVFHAHPCLDEGASRAVEAGDVVSSLHAAFSKLKPRLPVTGLAAFLAGDAPTITGITAPDDGRVRIGLDRPAPHAEAELARVYVVPRQLDGCDDPRARTQPVGTGPFRFEGPAEGDVFRLVRAPRYWGRDARGAELPYLDGVEIRVVSDALEASAMLVRGDADVARLPRSGAPGVVGAGGPDHVELTPRAEAAGLTVARHVQSNREMFMVLLLLARDGGLLADTNVRRAVALGVDRGALARLAPEATRPLHRLLLPHQLGYAAGERGYPDAAARALLGDAERAGHELYIGTYEQLRPVADALVTQLGAVGLTATVVPMTPASAGELMAKRELDAVLATAYLETFGTEPYPYLGDIARQSASHGFTDPTLDALADEVASEPSRANRAALFADLEARLLELTPLVPIAHLHEAGSTTLYLLRPEVGGLVDGVTGRAMVSARGPMTTTYLSRGGP